MDIKIRMLNVKDGDAIIIELIKPDKTLIMIIDGGESSYYETKVKPTLQSILKAHNKKAPDIVVCTHYDSDHIGGLIPLIEDYIEDIKEVWVHKTPEMLKGYIEKAEHLLNEKQKLVGNLEYSRFKHLFEDFHPGKKEILDKRANLILESLPQLKKLINLIPDSKLRLLFYRQQPLNDWKEITILGPTKEFYDRLFPSTKSFESFITEEAMDALPPESEKKRLLELAEVEPCDRLKKYDKTSITSTNKASIIIAIDDEDKRYLFSGDAGIESFKAIPNWEDELKDLYFLKIPHHASNNNISKKLIDLMQPEYAFNSGYKYQDDDVIECIAGKPRCKEVKSTKIDGNLYFEKLDNAVSI